MSSITRLGYTIHAGLETRAVNDIVTRDSRRYVLGPAKLFQGIVEAGDICLDHGFATSDKSHHEHWEKRHLTRSLFHNQLDAQTKYTPWTTEVPPLLSLRSTRGRRRQAVLECKALQKNNGRTQILRIVMGAKRDSSGTTPRKSATGRYDMGLRPCRKTLVPHVATIHLYQLECIGPLTSMFLRSFNKEVGSVRRLFLKSCTSRLV